MMTPATAAGAVQAYLELFLQFCLGLAVLRHALLFLLLGVAVDATQQLELEPELAARDRRVASLQRLQQRVVHEHVLLLRLWYKSTS